MSCHKCKAGTEKLVVMYDGRIIPCEAFKGLVDDHPELVLGNVHDGDTLEDAQKRAMDVPLLRCIANDTIPAKILPFESLDAEDDDGATNYVYCTPAGKRYQAYTASSSVLAASYEDFAREYEADPTLSDYSRELRLSLIDAIHECCPTCGVLIVAPVATRVTPQEGELLLSSWCTVVPFPMIDGGELDKVLPQVDMHNANAVYDFINERQP